MLLDYILLIHPAYFYLGAGFFLIISLLDFKKIPQYKFILPAVLVISIVLTFLISVKTITIILIIQHVIILVIILQKTIMYISEFKNLNIFHFILLLYEITIITRFIVVHESVIFFYISAAFGIFIGIFFLIYNEKNSPKIRV
jgi:hypothetical protein